MPGVVRHFACPDEIPECRECLLGFEPGLSQQVEPEERAAVERRAQPVVELTLGPVGRGDLAEHRRILAEVDGDTVEAGADPDDLARGAELVELGRSVPGHPPRQHLGFPERDRQRQCLQRHKRFAQRGPPVDPVPTRQKAAEGGLLRRLDFLPQRRQRGPPQPSKHVWIAPLALGPAWPQLAADEQLLALELVQDGLDVDPEALFRLGCRERPAPLGVAQDQPAQRLLASFEVDIRQTRRRHDPERIAIAARILGGDQALLPGDSHSQRSPLGLEHCRLRLVELTDAEIAAEAEQVVQLVGVARVAAKLGLDLFDSVGIEQLAELLLAEQLPQELAVERQRLCPPLRGRRVVLVHVGRDIVEQQRG